MSQENFDLVVVVTTHNSAETIKECLDSVNRLHDGIRIILFVHDDGSTDNTKQILASYKSVIPFQYFFSDKNQGRPFGLINGIRKTKSKYISILDSDDVSTADRLSESFHKLEACPELDLVSGQIQKFGSWGREKPSNFPTNFSSIESWLKAGRNPIAHSAVTFRRSWYEEAGGYSHELPFCLDYDLFLRGLKNHNYFISEKIYCLYRTENRTPNFSYWKNSRLYRDLVLENFRRSAGGTNKPPGLRARTLNKNSALLIRYFLLKLFTRRIHQM
jgi:glycosyltransferase involved in cell wall biosynthesis